MTPLLAKLLALLVVFIGLIMLLLMGYLLWLQRRSVAEQVRQREARRQWLATRWPGRFPPPWKPPLR
jgi:uncharacterized iron-regulated membrane protein